MERAACLALGVIAVACLKMRLPRLINHRQSRAREQRKDAAISDKWRKLRHRAYPRHARKTRYFFTLFLSPLSPSISLFFSFSHSFSVSRCVYNGTWVGEIPSRGGMSNLIEIPLCEIVEKSSHAIAGACAKMELREETRFVRWCRWTPVSREMNEDQREGRGGGERGNIRIWAYRSQPASPTAFARANFSVLNFRVNWPCEITLNYRVARVTDARGSQLVTLLKNILFRVSTSAFAAAYTYIEREKEAGCACISHTQNCSVKINR